MPTSRASCYATAPVIRCSGWAPQSASRTCPLGSPIPLAGALEEVVSEGRAVTLADVGDGAGLDPVLAAERPEALMAAPFRGQG